MSLLVILNDRPHGRERSCSGRRPAGAAVRQPGVQARVFRIGGAAACAKNGPKVPAGHDNVQSMMASAMRHGAAVGVGGTCLDARGLGDADRAPGARRSAMEGRTLWSLEADRVVTF